MTTSNQSQRINLPVRGVMADTDPVNIGMEGLREAQNWILRQGDFIVRPGVRTFTNAAGDFDAADFDSDDFVTAALDFGHRPMGITQYDHHDGVTRTVVGTTGGWYALAASGLLWESITAPGSELTGSAAAHVLFKAFPRDGETQLIGVNGANTPKVWDGIASTYTNMGGNPPIARCVAVAANRVLLGNLLSGPTTSPVAIDVSAFNDFNSGWGSVQTTILSETPGEIVAMEELSGLSIAIYKRDAIHVCSAVGGIDPFAFELRRAGVSGPVSPASVAKIGDGSHVYRALDGSLMRFDGVNLSDMSSSSRFLFNSLIQEVYKSRSFVLYDPRNNEVWTFFCDRTVTGDPNVAIVDTLTPDRLQSQATWLMRWGTRRFSAARVLRIETSLTIGELIGTIGDQEGTIGEYGTTVQRMGLCGTDGVIYEDVGRDDDGDPIPTYWETGLFDVGYPGWKDFVESNHYLERSTQSQTVSVMIGVSDDGAARVLSPAETFNVSSGGPYIAGHRISGRLMSMRLETNATDRMNWRGGFVSIIPRGLR